MFGLPVDLRMRFARRWRITGPKVSGRKARKTMEAPATIRPIQKAHRQLMTETKPEMLGASWGPTEVAC